MSALDTSISGNVDNDAPKRRRLRRLRLTALGLLLLAVAGLLLSAAFGGVGAWGWSLAFFEAAAVGALADWFAVAALFRHPLGLRIPHTDVLARRKDEIGAGLADFVSEHFLQPEQLAAKLREQAFLSRFAARLAQPEEARRFAGGVRRQALALYDALSGSQLEKLIAELLTRALARLDLSRLSGNWLALLTRNDRHHDLLDEFLRWLADLLGEPAVQDRIYRNVVEGIENKSGWWRALNKARIVDALSGQITEALPQMIENLQESLRDPEHPYRKDFDNWLAVAIYRLQNDPQTQAWLNERVSAFLAGEEFRAWAAVVGQDARRWLRADLEREDSMLASWLAAGLAAVARRIHEDTALRDELERQTQALAVALAPAVDTFLHKHIRQTVSAWDERELVARVELEVGADLQYIRFNGTLIGGCVGLLLHALVVFAVPLLG